MIKYLGSKRTLISRITAAVAALPSVRTVIDLFSGTSRVGHAFKRLGYRVLANDHNAYAAVLARCYVEADREDLLAECETHLARLNALAPKAGWFTKTFCEDSRYLQPHNGARVDAIRRWIAQAELSAPVEAVLLTSLLEAADRVDSTTGVQMAYLKSWADRSYKDLELRMPDVLPQAEAGKGAAFELEAEDAIRELQGDVMYFDPPYNQHKYLGNYHVWESLVRWDCPEVYGIARKRVDCRTRRSDFNSRPRSANAMQQALAQARARHLVVSFSNEGYFRPEQIVAMLQPRGRVLALGCDYRRYVGAQIGIHNPAGERVGKVSHLHNKEYLFVATPDAEPGTAVEQQLLAQGFVDAGAILTGDPAV